ncbi:MAG TPA: type I-MYXAN CRISPR-associated protein Cas5/Cmx5/DevS [Gemmataceae bacterium]|jgi:CRISPR-associated protein Cas5t|nr:type I-MYXAN CRISPR-associated protein Cas5/Cmx5/DevS [Gemmataceae bacterium]
MLRVYVEAPFAAFRTFTAGWYRPTAAFLTPSAAYGLLLNVAGIESRLREEDADHPGKVPASLTRSGLPSVRIAVGVPMFKLRRRGAVPLDVGDQLFPHVQSVYQQLHNYPVGKGNKVDDPDNPGEKAYQGDIAERRVKGNKSNITPVRREFLTDLRAVIAVDGIDTEVVACIRRGLGADPATADGRPRYGVPFLGDNAFLPDRLEELTEPRPVRWYERLSTKSGSGIRERATRLTVQIDRADLSRTVSHLYAPAAVASDKVPQDAWTPIGFNRSEVVP